jgi:Mor family transcriptional regulator
MKGVDILDFVLHEVMRQHPSYTETQARVLLPQLHEMLGGDSYYIAKRAPAIQAEQRQALFRDALGPSSNRELQERHGVSRATLYRLMKKPPEGG